MIEHIFGEGQLMAVQLDTPLIRLRYGRKFEFTGFFALIKHQVMDNLRGTQLDLGEQIVSLEYPSWMFETPLDKRPKGQLIFRHKEPKQEKDELFEKSSLLLFHLDKHATPAQAGFSFELGSAIEDLRATVIRKEEEKNNGS